ncbi:MAG: hypothetical protein M1819_004120 [Sarea resinae]|nr:MAG: hypothetical protein M1819_004120 [Sarea resinae]
MPTNYGLWGKMIAAGVVMCIGGPALVYYVTPTEEELFKTNELSLSSPSLHLTANVQKQRYNPDLQRRSLEKRAERQEEYGKFINKLQEYSKSDKPMWVAAAEDQANNRAKYIEDQAAREAEIAKRKEEIRRQATAAAE